MEPRRRSWRTAIALTLPLATLTALFPGAVLRGESFYVSDLAVFHRPIRSLLLRLAHESGGLPLWNPYLALGQPYAANPHYAVFHPTTVLFFLLPFETAFRWQVMLPVLAAFFTMVFFLRTLGRSFAASVFGGIGWAFGGSFLSGTILLPIALTLAPMPATLAFAVRLARAGTAKAAAREGACLALSFGLQGLAGEPGSLFLTMGLALAAVLDVFRSAPRRENGAGGTGTSAAGSLLNGARSGALVAAAIALGIGVAGVSLLPGVALGARSSRALPGGIPASQAALWSMPAARAAEAVFPRSLGYLDRQWDEDGWYWGAASYPKRGRPFLFSVYAGALVVVLAAAGIARRPRGFATWLAAAGVCALLALGPSGFLWTLARRVLPLFANIRYPERWFLGTAFVIVVAAAFGLDAVREGARLPRRLAVWGLASFTLASAVAALAAVLAGRAGGGWFARTLGAPSGVASSMGPVLARDLLIEAALAAAGTVALMVMSPRRRAAATGGAATNAAATNEAATHAASLSGAGASSAAALSADRADGPDPRLERDGPRSRASSLGTREAAATAALVLLVALDLVHAFRPFAPTAPVDELGVPPPAFAPLLASRPQGPIFHYASYDPSRAPGMDLAAPPAPALWGLATTLEGDFDISELAWSRRATLRFFEASTSDPALVGPLLARRGVAAIVRARPSPRAAAPPGALAEPSAVPPDAAGTAPGGLEILRPNGSLPFLACLLRVETAPGDDGWLAAVRRLGPEAGRTAVLDAGDPRSGGAASVLPAPSACEAALLQRTPTHIAADVRGAGPGPSFLAIDQTWDTRWQARIDGKETPLLRTDIALSALIVTPGSHRVELDYSDPWIARGAIASMLSLAVCGALVLVAARRERAERRSAAAASPPVATERVS